MTALQTHARIVLHKLEFLVFLGWGDHERAQKQPVMVDVHIDFMQPPQACQTDQLGDTFCYDLLNQTITKAIESNEFKLLEHLAFTIYACVKAFLTFENKINICVTKYPDLFFKSNGVSCWYGDTERVST